MLVSDNETELKIEEELNKYFVQDDLGMPFIDYHESNLSKIRNAITKDNVTLFEEIIGLLDVKEMARLFQLFRTRTIEGYQCEKFIDILFKKINFGEINLELEYDTGVKMKQILITGSAELPNTKYIKQLIDLGFNIMIPDRPNEVLVIACMCGNLEMVKFLIEFGLDPNYNNAESFREACNSDQIETCRYLLKYGINIDFNCKEVLDLIIRTIGRNNYEMLQLLIDNGANLLFINQFVELESRKYRNIGLFDLLVSQGVKEKNAHILIHNMSYPRPRSI
ncbi:ankyrin repeat protein [Acanthamoeba polyphaga moumouvirus]|uniref:Ankyrin repeat protein n=1 Tax=Acanthamoeba polyphaga moumouvirus TaxID=1269028 RepID=L7RD06_9VIRU|nr:ankyrin repeat protein [Acanthamoeba polyphaga moumouvirus]AGC02227.1 ankyrin repeat protein [Acanthamoeba polyphaga moumouvirus]